jgi:hypothetical protein
MKGNVVEVSRDTIARLFPSLEHGFLGTCELIVCASEVVGVDN